MATSLFGRDVIRIQDLSLVEVNLVMQTALKYSAALEAGQLLDVMKGKILATLFYEPSTRTRLSFETAMLRLGGLVVSVAEAKSSSSAAKGETLFDTGKMIEGYSDVAVIRHPVVGSAKELADGSGAPVINGGDGAGQHPTQALLDLYTILKEKGKVDGLTVTLAGDLKNGRTVHSLSNLLSNYKVKLNFASPKELAMPLEITESLKAKGANIYEIESLEKALTDSDVVYMTRIQKERFADPEEYERLKGAYILDRALVNGAKKGLTIMHPLPRVNEISTDVDDYEGAAYFRQAANGVPVRMALLALVTGMA